MAINRFDPFRDLAILQDRMNRFFNDANQGALVRREEDVLSRGTWMPAVDVYEQESELVLKAELPGLKREEIDVTVENSTLTIKGERKLEQEIKQDNVHRVERAFGSFSRSFSLAPKVDASKISADYKDGVLTLRLPFREDAKPRTIKIDVAA
jgi:HSP20 family protein